jgi:hypothetical protein
MFNCRCCCVFLDCDFCIILICISKKKIVFYCRRAAMDKENLKQCGFTHIINCAQGQRSISVNTDAKFYKDLGIKFYGIKATDTESFDISKYFRPTANIIHQALEKGGN